MSSSIDELEGRLFELKKLAHLIKADTRHLSSSLELKGKINTNDVLITMAEQSHVPMRQPLTLGTLLASVLGEIESVEWALRSLTHRKPHPN